jgi:hypothetical protein
MSQGQVSQALLAVGGDVIQQDLKAKYPQGIQHGELAVSVGGKLMCKILIHCCLPEQKDVKQIEQVCLPYAQSIHCCPEIKQS